MAAYRLLLGQYRLSPVFLLMTHDKAIGTMAKKEKLLWMGQKNHTPIVANMEINTPKNIKP